MGISSAHVLAVAPDALDAQDALQLWSVFSKCKDSLQDGRRLENISWRLAFRELSQNRRLLDGPWPPTPESVSSDDSGGTKSSSTDNSTSSSDSAASPFFHIAPRSPTATAGRPAGRIICDMIPPGLTQKLTERQKDVKKDQAYPTPASSSSSSSGSSSTSSSSVSISVESPAAQEPEVPRVKITNATPNLTPHPTPPATPLLAATAPPRALSPSGLSTPASLVSSPPTRRDPPGPLFLPRSATRGMGSPVFPPLDSQHAPAPPAPYAPQSTHILPLGGRELTAPIPAPPVNGNALGKSAPRGKGGFYLHAPASGSSHSSSRSSGTSNSYENDRASASGSGSGSDSSRERGEETSSFVHGQRGVVNARGRGRGRAGSGGRRSSSEECETQIPQQQEQQQKSLAEVKQQPQQYTSVQQPSKLPISHQQPPPQQQPPHATQQPPHTQQKPPRVASAPFLGGVGLGLEMTAAAPHPEAQVNGCHSEAKANGRHSAATDADDARSVSSLATSSSHVRMRVKGKQPARTAMRSQRQQSQSRSRSRASRKGGTGTRHGKEASAPNALGLPSNLAAAAALVERTMGNGGGRRKVVLATSDEEDGEWSDDEDDSGEGVESGEGEVEEVEEEEEDGDGWEDEDEDEDENQSVAQPGAHTNAKAPPPSLQQQQPHLGHARGHSTGGVGGGTDLRQLPTRPTHRSAGHLPALANAGAAHAKHHHTTSANNARTVRALKATMSETTISSISSALLEEKRRRELFPKAPRNSYENLTALASSRPGGLTLLLGGRPQLADQYQQQQQQLQQQIGNVGGLPPPRMRPAGGFGGLGLTMSSTRPPTAAGGAELSPIPPTPATAVQQQQQPSARRQQPPSPLQHQQQPGPPPRRPGLPRALSSSALPPHFGGAGTSGSFGKSSVAGPVVSVADPVGANNNTAAVAGGSTTTQNGSAGTGRGGGYRPKGPPAEMEYDDEEDDESDADGRTSGKGKGRAPDEGLQLSKSVAQEKLRVLAEKSAILSRAKNGGAVANAGESAEAERRRLYEQAGVVPWAAAANNHNVVDDYVAQPPPNRSMSTAPVGFPYNLPAPAPPSTPRTTRQQMLRNEMSESLRHNLLWQRKLSRTDVTGPQPRRTKSTVNVPGAGQGGRQAEKSLVRVTLREPGTERREALPPMDPPVLEGAPKKKLVRNLSWADTSDYHRTGW